jgi:hypothetical protein
MLHTPVSPADLTPAAEYLAATGGAGDAIQWVIIWAVILCGVLYFFRYRDGEHEVSEDFKKALGKKRGRKSAEEEPPSESTEAAEEPTSEALTAAEVEALVDRRVAERMSAMSVSAPIPHIPQQRSGEQAPPAPRPTPLQKDPEAVQEPLPGEEVASPAPAPVKPPEAVQRPVGAAPLNQAPVQPRERLVMPEVKKTTPAHTATAAPHITGEDEPLEATPEEKELLDKLTPEVWEKIAPTRRLGETVVESAVLTRAGIKVVIKLNGDWTLPKFQAREESVRMLLAVREGVMTRITASGTSGWVVLSLRTRSACPTFIPWYPGAPLGFCTVTGKEIRVDFRRHLAIAGASNMGKSVTARNIFADVCFDAVACLIYCDPKMVEGALWRGRARVALDPDEIHDVALELDEENTRRKNLMQQRGWDKWIPSPDDPTLIVPVDEGASLVADAKDSSAEKEERIRYKKTLSIFVKGAREWRSQGIHIIWMTQYPTVEEGMPQQIGANIPDRISMALGMERHAEVVFDKENVANGWKAHKLPRSPKGLALVKVGEGEDVEPNPVQVVYLDKDRISELPLSGIWYPSGVRYATPAASDEPEVLEEAATVYGKPESEAPVAVNEEVTTLITRDGETVVVDTPTSPLSPEDKVLEALLDSPQGTMTFSELMAATSMTKSTLHRLLTEKMMPSKLVVKGGHNEWKLA